MKKTNWALLILGFVMFAASFPTYHIVLHVPLPIGHIFGLLGVFLILCHASTLLDRLGLWFTTVLVNTVRKIMPNRKPQA